MTDTTEPGRAQRLVQELEDLRVRYLQLENRLNAVEHQRATLARLLEQHHGLFAFWHRHLATSWLRRNHPELHQQAMRAASADIERQGGVTAPDYIWQLETVIDLLCLWVDIDASGLARPRNTLALAGVVDAARRVRPPVAVAPGQED